MMHHPLIAMLDCAVPLYIAELQAQGGPTDSDIEEARTFGSVLAARGDVLLFGGKPGEASDLADRTARGVAVLAFCPGGVTLFGRRWEAGAPEAEPASVGAYYTPAAILRIVEPQAGSGVWLAETVGNPPWDGGA